jgi:hypothetical protein
MDANAYALVNAPASESLAGLLRGATWLGRPAPLVQSASAERASGAAASSSSLAAALPTEPLASPVLVSPPPSPLAIERRGDDVHGTIADRSYRVRGLAKNLSPDALRVNLLVKRGESASAGVHVDTLDLYAARARGLFVAQAARELGVSEELIKRDVGAVILALEALVAEQIARTLTPAAPVVPTMTEPERSTALGLLRDPHLLDRILADFERAGVVGEETNKLVGYLAAVSRKLAEPLAVIIQSASAAGKTALMDAVLAFVPPEEQVQYSAMTGQALFYMAETNLKHKVLAVVEEEGAERASYALKLLQSEGELTIASTGKDPDTGKLVTHEYRVEGPVMIMLTTTAVELDEELVNRALVLTVDEDRAQTRAIHQRQRVRRTLDGLLATVARTEVLTLHRNAQRLLEPVHVVNPYAPRLTFLDARTRTRRDHEKYLTLIDTVAFLHQHQRARKSIEQGGRALAYIEVTLDDIAIANRLADHVLGRSLDELPPQARKLLALLTCMVQEIATRERAEPRTIHFSRRQVREYTGWTDFQVRVHLAKLETLEYVLAHRGTRGQLYIYELLYRGEQEREQEGERGLDRTAEPARPRFLMGLLDVDQLRNPREYDPNLEGSAGHVELCTTENEHRPSPDRAPDVPTSRSAGITDNVAPVHELSAASAISARTASRNGTHAPRRTVAPGARP